MPTPLLRAARAVDGGGDPRGEPGADLVGQPGAGVGLVHDDRHAAAGGQVGGQRNVAAETDDDVRVDLGEHLAGPRAPPTAPAAAAADPVGLRGSGTGGISSSG